MGNNNSSGRAHHEETVDFGYLTPQGVYTAPRDFNQAIVSQLICARRLAPFYRPLEDYDEKWDDEHILAARKEFPDPEGASEPSTTRVEAPHAGAHKNTQSKRLSLQKETVKPEAAVYRGAVECPICFLYYPPNINHSRCCDQAICTECFVQIKRTEPTTTHLVSEPAACPYCVQENFGVVYTPPIWRAGIGSDVQPSQWSGTQLSLDAPFPTHKRRQKSYGADSPEVVTTDQIRPDWEAKLAAVRAAVTRRANRRIIMRQVGDRLVPVGVTSGRVHAIAPEEGQNDGSESGSSRRSRRRQHQNQELNQIMGSMGLVGQDLEDIMVMEAMRLSLLDHEEHLRREAQNRNRSEGTAAESEPARAPYLAVPGDGMPNPSHSDDPTPSSSAPVSSTSSSLSSDEAHSHHRIAAPAPVSVPQSSSSINPIAALQGMSNTTTSWRRRTSSPPPFTTLSAVMGASATATAVLGTGNTITNTNATASASNDTSLQRNDGLVVTSAPLITIGDSSAGHDTEDTSNHAETLQPAKQNLNPPVASSSDTDFHAPISRAVSAVETMVTAVDRRN